VIGQFGDGVHGLVSLCRIAKIWRAIWALPRPPKVGPGGFLVI
jgi:hypothetical protein